jgi:hypothetical protein
MRRGEYMRRGRSDPFRTKTNSPKNSPPRRAPPDTPSLADIDRLRGSAEISARSAGSNCQSLTLCPAASWLKLKLPGMTAIASAAIYHQLLQRTQHGYNTLCKPLMQRREFVTHGYDIRYSAAKRRWCVLSHSTISPVVN